MIASSQGQIPPPQTRIRSSSPTAGSARRCGSAGGGPSSGSPDGTTSISARSEGSASIIAGSSSPWPDSIPSHRSRWRSEAQTMKSAQARLATVCAVTTAAHNEGCLRILWFGGAASLVEHLMHNKTGLVETIILAASLCGCGRRRSARHRLRSNG